MPISKGINIIESISTAPTREPRPASVVVFGHVIFVCHMGPIIIIRTLISYYNFDLFL